MYYWILIDVYFNSLIVVDLSGFQAFEEQGRRKRGTTTSKWSKDVEEGIDFIDLCGGEKQVRTNNKQEKQTNRHAKNIIFIIFLNVFLAKQRASQTRTAAGKATRHGSYYVPELEDRTTIGRS